jgi:predicted nuclease with RNAse H fold
MFAGVDVGGDRLHAVVLDERRRVADAFVADPAAVEELVERLVAAGVRRVGVDAPDAASAAAHAANSSLTPKFRHARCGEIALGRERGIWVSWATPVDPPFARWMEAGFAAHAALRSGGVETVEVYPHAAFRVLAGGSRPPSKTTPAGLRARVDLLEAAGVRGEHLAMWSHDALDAAAAALVVADEHAVAVTCGHDGSAIWLPASPATLR